MNEKERGKAYSEHAVTESATEVIEALHRRTVKEAKKLGVFEVTSLWNRLAERSYELMVIIQENDMTEDLIRGLMDKYDNDEDEVRLFPVEMEFLIKSALEFNRKVSRKVSKKLKKSPKELSRIMKTEALVGGVDAEFVRNTIEKMTGND